MLQSITNEIGEFCFNSLLPGKYWICAEAQGLAQFAQYVDVDSGVSNVLDFSLEQSIVIEGFVRDKNSLTPIKGATVNIKNLDALVDDPGQFTQAIHALW